MWTSLQVILDFLLMYNLKYLFYHLSIVNIDSVHVEPVVSSIENNMLVDIASNDIVNEDIVNAKNAHLTHVVNVDGFKTVPSKSIRVLKSNKSFGWFIF